MSQRAKIAYMSFFLAVALTSFFSLAELGGTKSLLFTLQEIFFDFNLGNPLFLRLVNVQNLMWWMFFLGLGELYHRHATIRENILALKRKYLSEDENEIYTFKDVVSLRRNVAHEDNLLANLIKTLILRYQASQKSVEETHQMLNSQLEMMQYKLDIDYNFIRYLCWIVPTLGFIGTVVGIALALNYAGQTGVAEKPEFISELTKRLSVAFYTTLVALIMSSFMVFLMHLIQAKEEGAIQKSGEYCLNFLINKLTSPQ